MGADEPPDVGGNLVYLDARHHGQNDKTLQSASHRYVRLRQRVFVDYVASSVRRIDHLYAIEHLGFLIPCIFHLPLFRYRQLFRVARIAQLSHGKGGAKGKRILRAG